MDALEMVNEFRQIFSDACVIDVDMSIWDKCISFWVLADHYRDWSGRCPMLIIVFEGTGELNFEFPQNGSAYQEEDKHNQWRIDSVAIHIQEGKYSIALWGNETSPTVRMDCIKWTVREYPNQMVDKVVPGWNKPFTGLARPGIDRLEFRTGNGTKKRDGRGDGANV